MDVSTARLTARSLARFPESVGITYYLVGRLAKFAPEDVEFYWPQLCHLLVSRPTDSAALETFILQRCEESTHVALLVRPPIERPH